MRTSYRAFATIVLGCLLSACGTTPNVGDTQERAVLHDQVNAALRDFHDTDPSLQRFFDGAYGYAVFPEIVTAAVGVGGAHGNGEVFQRRQFVGYADLSQGSVGVQLGAQKYEEIIFFENEASLIAFKKSDTEFDARATAVAAKAGAAATADYRNGVVVFTRPLGGLMAQAAIGGQKFRFEPAERPIR